MCKGYVHNGKYCELATTSECPEYEDYILQDKENVEELKERGGCGSNHGGCYIKDLESKDSLN